MATRARRNYGSRFTRVYPLFAVFLGLAGMAWWLIPDSENPNTPGDLSSAVPRPALASPRPEIAPVKPPTPGVTEKGARPSSPVSIKPSSRDPHHDSIRSLLGAADQANHDGEVLVARENYSQAMLRQLTHGKVMNAEEQARVRGELSRIGRESILSSRVLPDDPHVSRYTIRTGDALTKIAKNYKVGSELLASINGFRNPNLIRAGQVIKVIHGPFRAVVYKQDFVMDVYLGDTFVTSFKVGLGADDGTPTGKWSVGTKLKNPTYYPPRGGQVIAADDPENPLGERWIALKGIEGHAVGALRYGIHGTIEPETIGKSMSLGCVRMYNEDVEQLYTLLVEGHSVVDIVE